MTSGGGRLVHFENGDFWAPRDYRIRSNFWKFYLSRNGFTLGELVSLVKVFRLFNRCCLVFGDVEHLIYWHGQRVCDAFFQE